MSARASATKCVVCTILILAAVLLSLGSSVICGKKKLLGGAREFPEGIAVIESIPEAGWQDSQTPQ